MKPIDYKKMEKQFYKPKEKPEIIHIPSMHFIYVDGKGNPGDLQGEYTEAITAIYTIAYTIKMNLKKQNDIKGYHDYVVFPLEGLWEIKDYKGYDASLKDQFIWKAMMRVPDFVTKEVFEMFKEVASKKKNKDFSKVQYMTFEEGLVVQMLHVGSYDKEVQSVKIMNAYIKEHNYVEDFNQQRKHHEIYLNDPRKTNEEKLKTILRHPIKKL